MKIKNHKNYNEDNKYTKDDIKHQPHTIPTYIFFRSLMTINQAIRQIYQNNIFKANALKPLTVGQVEIKIMEPTRIKGTHLY